MTSNGKIIFPRDLPEYRRERMLTRVVCALIAFAVGLIFYLASL